MSEVRGSASLRKRLPLWKRGLFALVGSILALALLEGLCAGVWTVVGLIAAVSRSEQVQTLKEDSHCQYDAEIGWRNVPETQIKDFYGTGRTLTINADGVRGTDPDTSLMGQPSRYRIICLGDSFTLGYGVDDRNTFPYLLGQTSPKIETVNMGQGGYSVGQSYLWLKQQGRSFSPDLVVAVFIYEDFQRLAVTRTVNGYATPKFDVQHDRLVVSNQPVPERLPAGEDLPHQVQIGQTLVEHSSLARTIAWTFPHQDTTDDSQLIFVGGHIILEMKALCEEWGCPFVLVLIPTIPDLHDSVQVTDYRMTALNLENFAKLHQIPFLDLQRIFVERRLLGDKLFLTDDPFRHYSATGNALVAEQLSQWLPFVVPDYPPVDQ